MTPKKNKACTLKVGQIERNPILALGTSEKDVRTYERVTKAYGSVAPAIVGQNGGTYRILAGQARLDACAGQGLREIPAIIAEPGSEADQMKLALLLSTVREEGGPLSEGAFIDALITRHGITRRELMDLLKKSKSWISKRQALVQKLTDEVKELVRDGVVCARSAEEIAKLPAEAQLPFASITIRDGLSKSNVGQLVDLYRRDDSGDALRNAILETPLTVLDTAALPHVSRSKEKRGLPERIAAAAGLLIRLSEELSGLLAIADTENLDMVRAQLKRLRFAVVDLKTVLDGMPLPVAPGKQAAKEVDADD